MGTNYYVKDKSQYCKYCKRGEELIHIGKSSAGWKFGFDMSHEKYKDIKTLKKFLKGKQIWDEYDRKITKKRFWGMVEWKQENVELSQTDFDETTKVIDGYEFNTTEFS